MTDSLDRDPVVLLHDVARIMRTKFDQRARSRGMTRAQWIILARVARLPGISQSELAAICEVEPITVARLVDRLEKRGLLERRADPNDRRIWRLHNLPAAQPILEEISGYRQELIKRIDEQIGVDSREAMVDALIAIRAVVTSPEPLSGDVGEVGRKRTPKLQRESAAVARATEIADSASVQAVGH